MPVRYRVVAGATPQRVVHEGDAALLERAEVEEVVAHRLLQLDHVLADDEDPRHVRLDRLDARGRLGIALDAPQGRDLAVQGKIIG